MRRRPLLPTYHLCIRILYVMILKPSHHRLYGAMLLVCGEVPFRPFTSFVFSC